MTSPKQNSVYKKLTLNPQVSAVLMSEQRL